ncbi:Alginate export [Nitrosomonas cryotolerans]|uniref:Alginate export n=1 Tax=Nitrosomonas cryotolerans ATCC 49181 TaxID=1131553 RepID=A0A1N6F6K4_9PROT|nr:alginate export family protein [Nitrosomonas cryotolerans]SFP98649.1 Alginate export [Nitrosomonas cryotolerans]SIN90824.1 Alginate export [Nitrosomonas cryotolerans ATCC 49181]
MTIFNSFVSFYVSMTQPITYSNVRVNKWCLNLCLSIGVASLMSLGIAAEPDTDTNKTMMAMASSSEIDWSTVPPATPMPRPGLFSKPAPASGYYSIGDFLTGNKRSGPPVSPYAPSALLPTSAFDIDFRYLETPGYEEDFFDPVKRIHLGSDWLLSFGGSFWYRYMHETDSRLNISGKNNDYHLTRTRVHADLWYRDQVRIFAEFLDARSFGPELTPLAIDRNHTDLLNLFADVKLGNVKEAPLYIRFGRQELLYGSQRLIAPLDWANTRRTFQGIKTFWRSPTWDVDAFWVRPMDTEKGDFDNWDQQRNFFGLWGTYKPMKNQLLDLYFLSLDDNRTLNPANLRQGNILQGDSTVHTLGGRIVGDYNRFLYELEGMYQFGKRSNLDISAFSVSTGIGYQLPLPMNPNIWIRYDFASGDSNPQDGRSNTFNHLFPFGHYYFGYLDQVGRQNIHDFNAQITLKPQPWFTFLAQYHRYYLANKRDFLYNAGGAATLRDPTGQSGSHVGDAIDFVVNFHIARHHDALIGYSKLFTGNFIENQRPGISPDLLYVQYNFRF